VVHAALLERLRCRLRRRPVGHGEAQMVQAAAERVEAVVGPLGIHWAQPEQQVAIDHDDAALQQVGGQVVVGVVDRWRGIHGDLEPQQVGVEGPGPLHVGDGEPQVVDRADGGGTVEVARPSPTHLVVGD
jgi:hypothetical protein